MSRRSVFFGSIVAIGFLMIAQMEYYPRSGMFAVMGMTGPRANRGRQCHGDFFPGLLRMELRRMETCYGPIETISPLASHSEFVSVYPFTHRLMHAATTWSLADSAEWRSKRDSVFGAISRLGGHPVGCATPPGQRWYAANAYYVKFPDFYLKVRAEKMQRDSPPPMPWVVSVEGFPQMPYECINRPLE